MKRYYKVIEEESITLLECEVESLMEDGWNPHGGVSFMCVEGKTSEGFSFDRTFYVQAMVKETA
jgi:hypothetical protein